MFKHKDYPIIVGASYINKYTGETGILEMAELFPAKTDALIEINMYDSGKFYKLDYATFVFYWELKNQ